MASIRVKNWAEFQHYKDRSPPWIKLHKTLLDNYEYQCLPLASRALAPMLWLLASESNDGLIEADFRKLAFRLRTTEQEIEDAIIPLILNGFFVDDSNTLATCKQNAMLETEEEREAEEDIEAKASLSDSDESNAKPKRNVIPYQQIVDLYHEKLPRCPRVEILTAKRKSQIGARWSSGELDTLESWGGFFEHCAKSRFLMGAVDPSPGHKRFVADLEWLTKESNYTKIVEGKYHG